MKKLSLLVFIFCFAQLMHGQVSIRAFIGANDAWQANRTFLPFNPTDLELLNEHFSSILLPYGGLQIQKKISQRFDLNLESQISFKGEQAESNKYKIKFMYLKLIPSVEFEIFKGFKCGAGVFGGIRIKEYLPFYLPLHKPNTNFYDFGGMASLAYSYQKLTFRAAYYLSTNVSYHYKMDAKKKNRVFQIGVGYRIFGTDFSERKR